MAVQGTGSATDTASAAGEKISGMASQAKDSVSGMAAQPPTRLITTALTLQEA
jgi:hypothetical protein